MQIPSNRFRSRVLPALICGGMAANSLVLSACQQTSQDPMLASETSETAEPAPSTTIANTFEESQVLKNNQVTSADRNHATALLMQWWDLFEAPAETDRDFLVDHIFAEDVILRMSGGDLEGRDAVRAALGAIPATDGRSHHLHTVDVSHLNGNVYSLEATFQYHIDHLDGKIEAGESAYNHKVRKAADGSFTLAEIKAEVLAPLEDVAFLPSYDINRARGALAYYLGTTDTLMDDYPALEVVLTSDAEIHGMFDPTKQTFNTRGDGVLRGIGEISPWLASRQTAFKQVAHTIGDIEVQSQTGEHLIILAQIETKAWPKTGDKIEISLPIEIEMVETGEQFMRINRIER